MYGDRDTFILSALISFFIRFVLIVFLIPGIRESEELKELFLRGYEEKEETDSIFKTLKRAFKRRSFRATFFVFLISSLIGALYGASGIYFLKDVLRLPLFYAIFLAIAGFTGFLIFIPFWLNAIRKYGAHNIMKVSLLLGFFTFTPILWITTLEEAMLFSFIGGMALGAYTLSLGPVAADIFDESTISDGKHQEAMYVGIRHFFFRFALIFQAIILTTVHIYTGYNPDPNAIQTPLAIWGIRIAMGLIPSLLSLMSFLIMHKGYDLVGEKKLGVKGKLRELGL